MSRQKQPAVLFDMDGVLVDSEPVILAAAIKGLSEYGVHANPEDFVPFIGAGEDRFIGGVAEKHGIEYKVEMKAKVYQIYLDIVPLKLGLYPGVNDLLVKLKEDGWKMAVASSADKIKIEANLSVANISQSLFSCIISGEDVVNKKPDPEIYLKAAEEIGTAPSNCIVIEDALNGIKAAKAAGMKCIAVATSFSRDMLLTENPDFICDNISDVYSVLKCIK